MNDKYLSPVTDSGGKHYKNAMVYLNHELEDLQKKLKDAKDEADKQTKELVSSIQAISAFYTCWKGH